MLRAVEDALATARIIRLVTTDEITAGVRERIGRRWPDSRLDYAVGCPWCTGVYAAAAVVLLGSGRGRVLVRVLAVAQAGAMVALAAEEH